MEILIKNMVCNQCVKAVGRILESLDIPYSEIALGKAVTPLELDSEASRHLDAALEHEGFERIMDRESAIVEAVKQTVLKQVRETGDSRQKLSDALTAQLPYTYEAMSRIFSQKEGRTVEKYYIAMKIEYVKEIIGYNQHTLSEIADITGFSSVAHLSKRFKEVTGMSPSKYKELQLPRKTLPEV